MLNNVLKPTKQIHATNTTYNINLYDDFIKININKPIAFINNIYNHITPNFKLLKHDPYFTEIVVNGYKKYYYKNKPIPKLIEYDAFYPEDFYYIWEILNEFKLIDHHMRRFAFLDDGGTIPLGHIEACMKYCEDNIRYESCEFIRIPFNKHKLNDCDKRFISIYSNHKDYTFNNVDKQALNYFNNNKFDFIISTSSKLEKNLLSLEILNEKSNCLIFIDDFLNASNDSYIQSLLHMFKKIVIYQPVIQDKLDKSCWLVLINYQNNKIGNSITNNLKKIKDNYYFKYIDNLLELYTRTIQYDDYSITYHNNECIAWANKYNMVSLNTNELMLDMSYIKYVNVIFSKNINMPKICIDDNKTLYYTDLHYLKRKLNQYKRLIDTKEQSVNNDYNYHIVDWNRLTDHIDLFRNLRKIVQWKYNAELVNNSWLKFYEIITNENIINKNSQYLKTFNICENNCSSIFAINHYIKNETNIKHYEWYVHTVNYFKEFNCRYDLENIFPDNWLLVNNGTLTSDNIQLLHNNNKLSNIDLIICDGSIKIPSDKFNEQESYTSKLIYTQIYTMLRLLPKDKSSIVKLFIPFNESMTISILYLLTFLFEKVKLIKPMTSHDSSSEIYCLCKKYIGYDSIDNILKNRLDYILNNYNTKYTIFDIGDINNDFIKEITEFSTIFVNKQINSIKRSLYLRNIYYYDIDLQNDISVLKDDCNRHWAEMFNIKPLNDNHKILY
ncbi:ribosomal RNA methyltransferase domain [Fadolivirus algeromassiliense]|jgi:23S rRNA U2552 (ribose-2'-O)-methylase RlmE/FtsJ|uniref:Ribosomal RNA methyltransferase domain n=1 Tax=Fadolivirus FV1/VV64 TaxID=3070911 RepID=A0A7D3R0I7_9VIRU|nr:ribosomal RNA methyltransferase domain [Fadolivirus algeromassiliense]QKF93742.1 ribosomal RNA methyltransferase domain [Fadolivirus FV1/VV64]